MAAATTNTGARATVPRSGARIGTDQSSPARGSRNGIGSAAATRIRAVPWRSASGATSQAQSAPATRIQAMRGSSITARAAIPAAAAAENDGSGPTVSRTPNAIPPASRPAPSLPGNRGLPASQPAGRDQRLRRRSAVARPTRLSVAGSTSPPWSSSSGTAAASAARSAAGSGRRAGSTSSASSIASHSSSGRSRRSRASEGSGRPRRRAVAAGPPARMGFLPVHAS